MTFWIVVLTAVAVILIAAVWLLDRYQDQHPPTGVDARDWQQISEEKDDDFARRRTLGHATHSRTAPTPGVTRRSRG